MTTPPNPNPNLTAPLTPTHRTLLLKHARSTVLLAVLPSTPLFNVKRDLLAALASRGITTFPGATTTTGGLLPLLPHDDPAALEFGVLVDRKDPSRGWRLLREDGRQSNGTATSKAGGRGGGGNKGSETGTVEAAGLVDGSWLAYRLSSSSSSSSRRRERRGRQQHDEEEEVDEDDEDEEEQEIDEDLDDPGWNVVIATFEEADAAAAAREAAEDDEDEEDEEANNINNIPIPSIPTIR